MAGQDRYDYDPNGNMVVRHKGLSDQQTLAWDAENRLTGVFAPRPPAGGGGPSAPPEGAHRVFLPMVRWDKPIEAYSYDADGRRVMRVTDTETTLYISGQCEVTLRAGVPMTVTRHYSFGGQRIAMREGQGPFTYLHADHLGSTLAATDSNGTVLGGNQPRYYAFGTERRPSIASLPTSFTYTGQRSDVGTGLMYYGARYYNSRLGTFVQPDTMVPQPSNPQSLNRYAYGLGNPVKYRDPTGHWVETAFDIVSIGLDIAEVKLNPSLLNVGALVVDVGAAVVPFIPSGAGWLARGGKAAAKAVGHADDVADAAKAVARVEDVRHATQTKWVQNVLNGIDLAAIKNPGRFGRAFYVAEEGATGVAEVAAHGGDAQKVIRFQLDLSRAKVLDLTDSKIAKAWGYVHDVDGYLDHQALADRAVEQGYNAIKFNSYRGAGANYAFLDNPLNPFDFEQWLIPQMVSPVP